MGEGGGGAYSATQTPDLGDQPAVDGAGGGLGVQAVDMAPLGVNPLAPDGGQPTGAGSNRARAAALMAEAQRLLQTPDEIEEGL